MFTSIDDNGRQKLNLVLLSELFTFIFRNKTKELRYSTTTTMNKIAKKLYIAASVIQISFYRRMGLWSVFCDHYHE